MSTPVLISDLDPVGVIDPANDLTIVHQGFTDKKATIAQIRNFDISLFDPLPSTAINNDLMVIGRGSTNYQIRFDQVSFVAGTQLWFYQDVAPSGWVTIPVGDCLLGVKGGSTYTVGGALPQGTWQTADHTLTTDQIPAHTHQITLYKSDQKGNLAPQKVGSTNQSGTNFATTSSVGGSQAHNHGNAWRPLAATGILCQKQP